MIDNGSRRYDVDFPDQLVPISPATANLVYVSGNQGTAAIEFPGQYKVVNFGFPFESITDPSLRSAVMERSLTFFGLTRDTKSSQPTSSHPLLMLHLKQSQIL